MRLIDADALLEKLNYQGRFGEDDEIYNLLTNAPTIQREGWVSVPIEPTEEMNDKAWQAYIDSNKPAPYNRLADAYKAMIQVAPTDTE